jgi:hypothetical protein
VKHEPVHWKAPPEWHDLSVLKANQTKVWFPHQDFRTMGNRIFEIVGEEASGRGNILTAVAF